METGLIYNSAYPIIWDWRVATDLFFGGMGVGAFLFAVLVDWRYGGKYRRICQTAAWSAPLFVVIGLLFLMAKMGRPMAMFLTFTTFAPTSPLWWGGIFQTVLVLGTFYYALKWQRPDEGVRFRTRLGWALIPIALIVGAYHGFVLSIFKAQPLWNSGPTVVAAVLSFVTTGIAAIMLIHLIRMKLAGRLSQTDWVREFLGEIHEVRILLGGALLAQVFTLFLWWVSLSFGQLSAQQALAAASAAYGPSFWLVGIGIGLLLPLLLGGYTIWRKEGASHKLEINMIWLTSALILVGGYVFRLTMVLGGQMDLPIRTLS